MKIILGQRLRELREEKGLSQMNLSKQIDITQSAIARYELELTEPRASDIKKYANRILQVLQSFPLHYLSKHQLIPLFSIATIYFFIIFYSNHNYRN